MPDPIHVLSPDRLSRGPDAVTALRRANDLVNVRLQGRTELLRETRAMLRDTRTRGEVPTRERLTEQQRRAATDRMRTWHNDALAHVHDLHATRTAMASNGGVSEEVDVSITRTTRRILSSLSRNAVALAGAEAMEGRWHVARQWAEHASSLRTTTATDLVGGQLAPAASAALLHSYATFMLTGNSPAMRTALGDAAKARPNSSAVTYWAARYELMAGNYDTAADYIVNSGGKLAKDWSEIIQIVLPGKTTAPWLPYPCNYYTYRHQLLSDDAIRRMQDALTAEASGGDPMRQSKAQLGLLVMKALWAWNRGISAMNHEQYGSATKWFHDCRAAILEYFQARTNGSYSMKPDENGIYSELVRIAKAFIVYSPGHRPTWFYFRKRHAAITLEELHELDWIRPGLAPEQYRPFHSAEEMLNAMLRLPAKVNEKIDAPLLALAMVFTSLGIAEANRQRRNFDVALHELRQLMRRHSEQKLLCEFIERPFVRILQAQILIDKGDAEYKARKPASGVSAFLARYQGLAAAETYAGVFDVFQETGQYVNRVKDGAAELRTELGSLVAKAMHPLAAGVAAAGVAMDDGDRRAFKALRQRIPVHTVADRLLVEPTRAPIAPHESLITFQPLAGSDTIKESNPLVYSLIATAQARLRQMEAGLNYLGYSDEFVPPWRFQFLLGRARYFAENARNAQRQYLNFLQNAEHEEFQELSVAQTVTLEKGNVRVESARVDQSLRQLEATKQTEELQELVAQNATRRVAAYRQFDARADALAADMLGDSAYSTAGAVASGALGGAAAGAVVGTLITPGIGTAIGAVGGALLGGIAGFFSSEGSHETHDAAMQAQAQIADEQRAFELENLRLAETEAAAAAAVARANTEVAKAMVEVAVLQRAAALLRHEFAVQSLAFMRNRTLGAELWYRLAAMIRGVSDTYLRYAVELAFLAEQSYEFEADRRVNVIRFDYDVSEIGSLLAADFLLADLDTLEQDLIVSEQIKQQTMQFVTTLSRDFPAGLQELRETGSTIINIPLETLERRFPGFYNLRVVSADVTPLAIMDRTRFSVELTHLGTSQVRMPADTRSAVDGVPALASSDIASWNSALDADWPVKVRVHNPETGIFTGAAASAGADPTIATLASTQRGLFEARGIAGAWRIDLSASENRIVPGTLTDFVLVFQLRGYYSPVLRTAIERTPRPTRVVTQWLPARSTSPDAFFSLQRTGGLRLDVRPESLSVGSLPGRLRNAGVLLVPDPRRPQIGRLITSHLVPFTIDATGALTVRADVPDITVNAAGLHVDVTATPAAGATASWRFLDSSAWQDGLSTSFDFPRPGTYDVVLRIVDGGRLLEYRMALAVSDVHSLSAPLLARPTLVVGAGDGTAVPAGRTRVVALVAVPSGESTTTVWKVPGRPAAIGDDAQFDLEPGQYVMGMTTTRDLELALYSSQRYLPAVRRTMKGWVATTNRTFAADGSETTAAANDLATHLFGPGELSPLDGWWIELPVADNPAIAGADPSGRDDVVLREVRDVVLVVEYETT